MIWFAESDPGASRVMQDGDALRVVALVALVAAVGIAALLSGLVRRSDGSAQIQANFGAAGTISLLGAVVWVAVSH